MAALIVWRRFSAWSKDNGSLRLEDLLGDLERLEPPFLENRLADLGLPVVQRRQAVQELDRRVSRGLEQAGVDLVGKKLLDALVPFLLRFAHREPDVGVEEIGSGHRFVDVGREREARPRGGCQPLSRSHGPPMTATTPPAPPGARRRREGRR